MDTFGEWLRAQREARKLTRQEFASRIGCSVAMLRKIEDDERRPSAQIAGLIAACLGLAAEERETLVRVARGELGIQRLASLTKGTVTASPLPRLRLPVLPTPLIGRKQEVDELTRLLRDADCRLLTLTGPGGMGKTRLSIEAASRCQETFVDGVFFVALAPVQSARLLVPILADAIGFVFPSDLPLDPRAQLFNYLSEKMMLLVLDNLEQLLSDPGVVEFLSGLLQESAGLKLIVTSREALDLQGEWVFEVQGLPLPAGTEVEGTSVELFLQRARRAHVGFAAAGADMPAIRRICSLLDGMPLGIELAAAWVRTLSCEEIARELERGLDFLSLAAKDLPARHRSMRAVFDHSWRLLSADEQRVLSRLSVFQGGFRREAAQQVAGATLPALSALVMKSLVRRSSGGRYDLHELVRQYAAEQLAGQPAVQEEVLARHGQFFMEFLCREDSRLRGAGQREAIAALTAEIDNLRRAQEWALAQRKWSLIGSTLRAYSALYDALGWAPEALTTLRRVRQDLESTSPLSTEEQATLAHVLTLCGLFAFRMAQHDQARQLLEQGIQAARPMGARGVLVEALAYLGIVTTIMGNPAGAIDLFREGLQLADDIQDDWFAALCLTELVGAKTLLGQAEDPHAEHQAAVEAWRRTGDPRFTAFGLNFLSWSAMAVGKYEDAVTALEESLAINHAVGDRWGLGIACRGLGLIAQARGAHSEAVAQFEKSLELFDELGARWEVARVFTEKARSVLALGDRSRAESLLRESLQLSMETHGRLTAVEAILGLADVYAAAGDLRFALRLLLGCIKHTAALPEAKARAEKRAAELKDRLPREDVEAAERSAVSDLDVFAGEILAQPKTSGR